MTIRHFRHPSAQRGVVLISSLLLLIVMTLIAVSMFHSFGIQELIAGSVREKQRALQSAEGAEEYGEIWLTTSGNILSNSVDCSTVVGVVAYNSTSVPYICMQPVASIDDALSATTVPWKVGGAEVGFAFFPGSTTGTGDMPISHSGGLGASGAANYYQVPRLYIGLVSSSPTQALYRIDAWNYAGTTNTTAVVEGNYVVTCSAC